MNTLYAFLFSWWAVAFIYGVGPIEFAFAWREYSRRKRTSALADRPAQIALWLLSVSLVLWIAFLVFPMSGVPAIGRPGAYSSWVHVMLNVNLAICAAGLIAGAASRRALKLMLPVSAAAIALHWIRVTIP